MTRKFVKRYILFFYASTEGEEEPSTSQLSFASDPYRNWNHTEKITMAMRKDDT